jgi:hypothetical protein
MQCAEGFVLKRVQVVMVRVVEVIIVMEVVFCEDMIYSYYLLSSGEQH